MIFGGLTSAGDLLSRNARNFPNDIGLIFGERRLTWKELDARARGFANSLFELDLERGDRVAIYAKNSNQWVEALFGLAQVGLVAVTVNYRLTANEVAFIVENSGAKAIICDASTEKNSLEVKEKVQCLERVINSGLFENLIENHQSEIRNPRSEIECDEPCMLLLHQRHNGFSERCGLFALFAAGWNAGSRSRDCEPPDAPRDAAVAFVFGGRHCRNLLCGLYGSADLADKLRCRNSLSDD